MTEIHEELKIFLRKKNYDLRESHNARWIDQKCTPDVVWSVADFVLEYVDNVKEFFTIKDIWQSDYARMTIAETFSKPGTDEAAAIHEYDKVFSQPLAMLCYAGVLKDVSQSTRHVYEVADRNILEYIAINDNYSLRFLCAYISKVLYDSGLEVAFTRFFKRQNKSSFEILKDTFTNFYHEFTPIKGDFEVGRIFSKVLNPLAYWLKAKGTKKGHISTTPITKSDLMYNRDNFRDVYADKPKNITRKEWLKLHPVEIRTGYFEQQLNHAKKQIKKLLAEYRENISELTMFSREHDDRTPATHIHHIFPKSEFPEIMHYIENLIALTPNQHFCFAHPKNNTQIIDPAAQKEILIAKTLSIRENLEHEEPIYEFENFLEVLSVGWDDESVKDIPEDDYADILHEINLHY